MSLNDDEPKYKIGDTFKPEMKIWGISKQSPLGKTIIYKTYIDIDGVGMQTLEFTEKEIDKFEKVELVSKG